MDFHWLRFLLQTNGPTGTEGTLRDPCGSNKQWRKNILETLSITTLLAGQQQKHLASNYAANVGRNDFREFLNVSNIHPGLPVCYTRLRDIA